MREDVIKLTRFVTIKRQFIIALSDDMRLLPHKALFLKRTSNYGKIFPKEGIKMKKQLLVIFMITIVLATVFVAGCTGPVESTATTISKITATTMPTVHAAGCNFVGDSSTHVFHSASCPCVSKIKPEHKVCFDPTQQAIATGYRPCQCCHLQ